MPLCQRPIAEFAVRPRQVTSSPAAEPFVHGWAVDVTTCRRVADSRTERGESGNRSKEREDHGLEHSAIDDRVHRIPRDDDARLRQDGPRWMRYGTWPPPRPHGAAARPIRAARSVRRSM